jgi:hypothetical protein
MKSRSILLTFILTFSLSSLAEIKLVLNKETAKKLSNTQYKKIESFFEETTSTLPNIIKNKLGSIEVDFEKIKNKDLPHFSSPQVLREEIWSNSSSHEHDKNEGGSVAYTSKFFGSDITIHSGFLPYIYDEELKSTKTENNHRTIYQTAKASLIHEIVHRYDLLKLSPTERYQDNSFWSEVVEVENKIISDYKRKKKSRGPKKNGSSRHVVNPLKYNISSTPSFKSVFKSVTANTLDIQSPDNYEFKNAQEAFAVNMEYFILDPEYKCRKPQLYHYFSNLFNEVPFGNVECSTPFVRIDELVMTKLKFSELDEKRIYQVHYLLAGPGKAMMSKWGHAMIRIVICSPEREEVSSECLKDISEDIVISFRANIVDTKMNYYKGLVGKYPSNIFLYRMVDIINEYTAGEDRELFSVPVNMENDELARFINKVQEGFWSYSGKYKFITNNCATETYNFFKGVFYNSSIISNKNSVVTPDELIEFLYENNKTDFKNIDEVKSLKQGDFYFPRFLDRGERYFEELKKEKILNLDVDYVEYIEELSPRERMESFSLYSGMTLDEEIKAVVSMMTIESFILTKLDNEYSLKNTQFSIKEFEKNKNSNEVINEYKKWKHRYSNYGVINAGYGVPYKNEVKSIEEQRSILLELNGTYSLALEEIEIKNNKELKSLITKIEATRSNKVKLLNVLINKQLRRKK